MLLKILMSYFLVFRFTGDAGAVIRKLEETKTGTKDEHDKQVMKSSWILTHHVSGFGWEVEGLVPDLGVRLFHNG